MGNLDVRSSFIVSSSPHIRAAEGTPEIMRYVCIALGPAFGVAAYAFGLRVFWVALLAIAACMGTELLCNLWRRKKNSLGDFSAVVSGLLLAATLPPNIPWWLPVIGGIFAMGIVKHAFGGLGSNIWNPALAARALLQISFPAYLNSPVWPQISRNHLGLGERLRLWMDGDFGFYAQQTQKEAANISGFMENVAPGAHIDLASAVQPDIVANATVLTRLKSLATAADGALPQTVQNILGADYGQMVRDTFFGIEGGCIAETSALALLIGGLFLLAKKIITWETPLCYLATVALLVWALPSTYTAGDGAAFTPWFSGPVLLHLCGGGLMLGAFFMDTDYVTTPLTRNGKIIFACGCGIITALIRLYSNSYPEGCCYSILLMNTCVPLIDSWTRPRKYGA